MLLFPQRRRHRRLRPRLAFLSLPLPPPLSPGVEACWPSPSIAASPHEALAGRRRPRAAPAAACARPRPQHRGGPHAAGLPAPPLPPPFASRVLMCCKCYRKPYLTLLHETLAVGSAQEPNWNAYVFCWLMWLIVISRW